MKNIKEIEVKVEGKEWEEALDKAYKKQKKDIKIDGFRKGAVPKDVFIKKVGIEALFSDAVDLSLNDLYKKVIAENNLAPVCEPKVDVTHTCDHDATFKFTIIERPEIKLGKYKNLGVELEDVSVTADEIKAEIKALRQKYVDIVENNDGIVEDGSTAVINFKGIVDGKELEGGSGQDYPLEIGSSTFIPGFETGLIGMKVNEEKVIKLKFPEDYVEELKNKDVEFTVKVVGIKKRILPELNEDFYKDLGYENVKTETELESEISKHLLEHKKGDAENKYIDELLKKAIENLEVEINSEIIEDEVERIINQYTNQLQTQGLTLDQYLEFTKSNIESLKKMMEPEAINRIKSRYLLEEIVKKEKIEVLDEEVKEETKKMAEMYQVTEEELLKMIGNEDMIGYDLKMRRAIEILKK